MKNEKGFAATGILYTILLIFLTLMSTLIVTYRVRSNILRKLKDEALKPNCTLNRTWDFNYTGSEQEINILCDGIYKLEVWGAQGGDYNSTYVGGRGGYSSGIINLKDNDKLYVYVGGRGQKLTTSGTLTNGGFNGGGKGYTTSSSYLTTTGGGASDIRIGNNSLYSRVIVAGGGGGSHGATSGYGNGGAGGGSEGLNGISSSTSYKPGEGGTQVSFGTSYDKTTANSETSGTLASFGQGGSAKSSYYTVGGGGGWYGGGYARRAGAGGGSGWVYTDYDYNNWVNNSTEGQSGEWKLNKTNYLINASTNNGSQTFKSPTGSDETGHSNNGYARITYFGGPGLYDHDGNQLATWSQLIKDYGLKIENNYTSTNYNTEDSMYNVLNNNSNLLTGTTLVIPDSVTSIGEYAFYNCTGLTSIILSDNITSIGEYAFSNCTGLTSIILSDNITSIGEYAFSNCTSLTSITIPNKIASIAPYTFSNCTSLKSITIPSSVTTIANYAFSNCPALANANFENKLNWYILASPTIEASSYLSNTSTAATYLRNYSDYYWNIGAGLYDGFGNQLATWDELVDEYRLDLESDYGSKYSYGTMWNALEHDALKTGKTLIIPSGITKIGKKAFIDCTELTNIILPDSVTSIGEYAFSNCTKLINITIPNNVTEIGAYAFKDCTSITNITIPSSVTSIGMHAFENCTSLKNVKIEDANVRISDYAFHKCTSLSRITIPSSVTSIGIGAFSNCTSLNSVKLSDGLTGIGVSAFENCTRLSSITIPSSVTSIGYIAFQNCSNLRRVEILGNINSIQYKTFYKCTNLEKVEFPSSVTSIEEYAFQDCLNLTTISQNGSGSSTNYIITIGKYAFQNCPNLTKVHFLNGIKEIGPYAFYGTNPNIDVRYMPSSLCYSHSSSRNGCIGTFNYSSEAIRSTYVQYYLLGFL